MAHNIFVKVFPTIFFNLGLYSSMYHILTPYNIFGMKMIKKYESAKCHDCLYVYISKGHYYMFDVYLLHYVIMYVFNFKLKV